MSQNNKPNWRHHWVEINKLQVHYVEQRPVGEIKETIILCHGFPHLWFSWHRQIPALAAAGYRVIAPDMRGMGQTSAPEQASEYTVENTTKDLLGLLDHLALNKAVFAGLDFGAFSIYDLALLHPERVTAIIGLENPAAPQNPAISPLTEYQAMGEQHFLHIAYFTQELGRADRDLSEAPREFFKKVFWALSKDGNYFDCFKHPPETAYIDAMNEAPDLPWSWLSEMELEFFVSEYSRSGFTGGLNWYRSMDIKWQERKALEHIVSAVPAYFLGSEQDVDLEAFHGDDPISLMRKSFPDLRRVEMIANAGHMVQLEKSCEVNRHLISFMHDIVARKTGHSR
ncbi:MAG: alpha/beta hydrolase [Pseudomonadales bacterium]|nr:alpha/beta hydrolase [Pseudomonadales bacterium]